MTQEIVAADFHTLGISPEIIKIIDEMKFERPTPIQAMAIPPAVKGRDILGIAQTGTGKTVAFGIPLIEHLTREPGRALILVPTRELALQIDVTMRKLGNPFNIRSVIVIGGMDMDTQVLLLKKETIRVIIATPGRLLDHLEQKTLSAADLTRVVLDEADRMLDMGFGPQIERIAKFLPAERQTFFFSATMPPPIVKLSSLYLKDPIRVEVAPSGAAPEKIVQELFIVPTDSKLKLLELLLKEIRGSVLIFTRTKASAWKLAEILRKMGHSANELHSDRTQGQRRHALAGFKSGLYRILVATDIASRGIDVAGIELVINYDLPDETENYVHRIGRTGRAGCAGRAITFATPHEGGDIRAIEALMKTSLKPSRHPGVATGTFVEASGQGKKKHIYEDAGRHAVGRPQFRQAPPVKKIRKKS